MIKTTSIFLAAVTFVLAACSPTKDPIAEISLENSTSSIVFEMESHGATVKGIVRARLVNKGDGRGGTLFVMAGSRCFDYAVDGQVLVLTYHKENFISELKNHFIVHTASGIPQAYEIVLERVSSC